MKDNFIRINRLPFEEKQTLGNGTIFEKSEDNPIFDFKTVELAWRNNKRRESCIPAGIYKAIKHHSPKFGPCLWFQNVPGRSEILMHPANFWHDLLGCVGPGEKHIDIDGDSCKDVTASRKTMNKILSLVPDEVEIQIFNHA